MNRLLLTAVAALALSGCATKDYVHEYVDAKVNPVAKRLDVVDARSSVNEVGIDALKRRADANDAALKEHAGRIARNEVALDHLSATAQDALERASAAGKLAEGKLLYEVAMSDDTLRFDSNDAGLSMQAKRQLVAFANQLKTDNHSVYIEIQGHTDATGDATDNLALGQARAEAVRRYLNQDCGIPLHRMSVISYGETAPVADNRTVLGRHANRRVVLVVLK